MWFFYHFSIHIYTLMVRIAALFTEKAAKWVQGRDGLFSRIEEIFQSETVSQVKIAWFHCASLGEFEQGRPVMEAFRAKYPDWKILLTFFSPSGFEIRKNYTGADWVFYLPADTRKNAKRFVSLIKPELVFFIKYEYWFNYLHVLKSNEIPVYIVSAIFRQEQYFFKTWGSWFRKQLRQITWFFLQDEGSALLLRKIDIDSFTVTGDTRFDRVSAGVKDERELPLIEKFCKDSLVIIAGSTWPDDEKILIPFIEKSRDEIKFIIIPHETDEGRISALLASLPVQGLRYSQADLGNIDHAVVLIIDRIGILSRIYRYSTLSYVGGGFGAGIHNILEAAVFGVPVIFGPRYEKFREARELVSLGGAFPVKDNISFERSAKHLISDLNAYHKSAYICRNFVETNKGATEKIMKKINV